MRDRQSRQNRPWCTLAAHDSLPGQLYAATEARSWRSLIGPMSAGLAVRKAQSSPRERQAQADTERTLQGLHVGAITVVGHVARVREHLPLRGEAAYESIPDQAPSIHRWLRVGPRSTEGLRLHEVAVLVRHRGMEIHTPAAGRREHEADGNGVDHGNEAERGKSTDGSCDALERNDQVQVFVHSLLREQQRVDTPPAVHHHVDFGGLQRVEHRHR